MVGCFVSRVLQPGHIQSVSALIVVATTSLTSLLPPGGGVPAPVGGIGLDLSAAVWWSDDNLACEAWEVCDTEEAEAEDTDGGEEGAAVAATAAMVDPFTGEWRIFTDFFLREQKGQYQSSSSDGACLTSPHGKCHHSLLYRRDEDKIQRK